MLYFIVFNEKNNNMFLVHLSNSLQPMDYSTPGSSVQGDSPGKNTRVSCYALLQGIVLTQRLNPGLPHCRQMPYHLSQQGSSRILEWITYPFSWGIFLTHNALWDDTLQWLWFHIPAELCWVPTLSVFIPAGRLSGWAFIRAVEKSQVKKCVTVWLWYHVDIAWHGRAAQQIEGMHL